MNIHEYQAKQLLAQYGVATAAGGRLRHAGSGQDDRRATPGRRRQSHRRQIADPRRRPGQRHLQERLPRRRQTVQDRGGRLREGQSHAGQCAGHQADRARRPARQQVARRRRARTSRRSFTWPCCSTASSSRPVVMASTEGGMDIEEVAAKTPEKIIKETIDPAVGMMPYQARKVAAALGLKGDLISQAAKLLLGVYKTWWECDASLVEINPLCIVRTRGRQGRAAGGGRQDSLDDNALYRHPNIQAMRDLAEEAPLEIEASKFNLNYIKLDGNIACLVNGAGLAMATMDIIQHFGGQPGQLPRRRRRRQPGAGHGGVQDHPAGPEREGHPGQHLRRHHGLQRHRHRHRRGGEGNRPETAARGPARRQQRRSRQADPRRIRPHHHPRRLDGRRGAKGGQGRWPLK